MAATQAAVSGLHSSVLMDIEATAIVTAYKALAAAQQRPGIEFGRLCFNFRKRSKVVSGGTTFDSTLDKLDIPRSTAYRWIARYEESIGMREKSEPAPKKPVASFPSGAFEGTQLKGPDFAEALALPDASPLAPKQEYEKNERGIGLLRTLASEVSAQYSGECKVTGTSGADNLPVTNGRYNITLCLKGVPIQRVTNALRALALRDE